MTRDELVQAMAEIVNGMQVPMSLGLPLGTADRPLREVMHLAPGWATTDDYRIEFERILRGAAEGCEHESDGNTYTTDRRNCDARNAASTGSQEATMQAKSIGWCATHDSPMRTVRTADDRNVCWFVSWLSAYGDKATGLCAEEKRVLIWSGDDDGV